ncbi:MAG: hypothetical protein ABFD96_14620 [Armatimonadia bacterium]
MSETTAKTEYCAQCGKPLGKFRTLMPPEHWPVHLECVAAYRARATAIDNMNNDTRGRP